ncbi:hypothetical protein SAMN02745704_01930 [Paucidesulfovibrio gracilis DSM 16080]|uniref:Uncharacterized protein n=1 Tax=Paucidesulfovibrio gracilis DSM 16080 TaxID=1121449 RepID=A0A1T4X8K3_9BACT|nr:hypothetical protein [Paucidesulfovibrio gracilis]SKA85906.1 hypothetical protein SAMN02745704_01930 [Paucidesulfovibrio gracilis DSM 16080]
MRPIHHPHPVAVALLAAMLLFPLLLPHPARAGSPGYPDTPAPEFFLGVPFGASMDDIQGLHPVAERLPGNAAKYKNVYYREGEPPTIGEAVILSVAYYFRNDRLRSVVVTAQGDVNAFLLKDQLIDQFGPGRQVGHLYGWTWDTFSVTLGPVPDSELHALTYTLEQAPEE